MAKGDIDFKNRGGHDSVPTFTFQTEAGATDIKAGEPIKWKSAGSPYVIPLVDADLTIGTDTQLVSMNCASDSTHTSTADGSIQAYLPLPGIIYRAKAKTSGNFDTQSEINALVGDRVIIDLTGIIYTIDESAGDGATNAFYIVGGDPASAEVWFTVRADATFLSGESV